MSLSTLHLDDKGTKYQPFPIDLVDALKILNHDRIPSTIPNQHHKQVASKNRPHMKIPPIRSRVEDRVERVKNKRTSDGNPKLGKLNTLRKPSKNVQPLGRTRAYKNGPKLDLFPTLRKLDKEMEKDRELQRVMNNLKLSKIDHHRTSTTSSKNKESFVSSRSGMDFTSSLIEGHNLTLKQLRDFWSQMPSYLTIQAASLKSKYGVLEKEGTDIDDIAIEIVKKWNQPTPILPQINITRHLYVLQEET